MLVPAEYQRRQVWREKFPAIISALLSVFEFILTVVIVGCEVGGDFVQFPRMNIFVGYWTFPFFMCAWISLAGASCCCRNRCCGITTLVFQCLAIPLALCVVGLDAYFLNNPTQCFFSNDCTSYLSLTYSYSSSYYYYSDTYGLLNNSTLYSIKVPLIRGQLAAGALMFVSCVIFIIIFAIANYRVKRATTIPYMNSTYGQPVVVNPGIQAPAIPPAVPLYKAPVEPPINSVVPKNELTCHNCKLTFAISPDKAPVELPINSVVPKNQLICRNCRSRFSVSTERY